MRNVVSSLLASLVAVTLGFAAACGGNIADDHVGSSNDDAGARDSASTPSPSPTAIPDAGSPRDSGSPTKPTGTNGFVLVQQDSFGWSGTAIEAVLPDSSQTCGLAQARNSCEIATCKNSMDGLGAGTITVSGAEKTVTLAPQTTATGTGYVAWQQQGSDAWPFNSPLTIAATGGDVSPFQFSVSIPAPLTVTAPSLAADTVVDSTADLSLKWSGMATGEVEFYLAKTSAPNDVLVCFFDAANSSATIPASLLASMRSADSSPDEILVAVLPTMRTQTAAKPLVVEAVTMGTGAFAQAHLH